MKDTSNFRQDELPPTPYNPPGLSALAYRIGTHSSFYQRLLALLHTQKLPDGSKPLQNLSTYHPDDPALALFDASALLGDVLTFYQERIANEGYLRTATEERSILELSRTIGYKLHPGVAASTYLAFFVEDAPGSALEVTVPQRTKVQSIPSQPGELPQTFETTEAITARVEWNSLKPYISQELVQPTINQDTTQLRLQGTNTQLQPGDAILLITYEKVTGEGVKSSYKEYRYFLTLQTVVSNFQKGYTQIEWDNNKKQQLSEPKPSPLSNPQVFAFRQQATLFGYNVPKWNDQPNQGNESDNRDIPGRGTISSDGVNVTFRPDPMIREQARTEVSVPNQGTIFRTPLQKGDIITAANQSRIVTRIISDPTLTVEAPPIYDTHLTVEVEAAFSSNLPRGTPFTYNRRGIISSQDKAVTGKGTTFQTQLKEGDIITAANQSRIVTNIISDTTLTVELAFSSDLPLNTPFTYSHRSAEWPLFGIREQKIDLDTIYPKVLPESWVVLSQPGLTKLYKAKTISTIFHSDFGVSGKITRIEVDKKDELDKFDLRKTSVFAQSEKLELFAKPKPPSPVKGKTIALEQLIPEIEPGRVLIVSGVQPNKEVISEVAVVKEQKQTIITLRNELKNSYDASTVQICANVTLATHGETVEKEVLGSGNGGQTNQRFKLKKPPLTYVSAATASGRKSTLQIYVNDVLWQEVLSLDNQNARSQCYMVQIDDQSQTTIIFGDGIHGARLPSGQENIVATYRSGIGKDGEVKAGTLTLLQNRPLGIREVTNLLPATGAADQETTEYTRDNAPNTILTLDRIVSLRDFENFSRTFAGVSKAQAVMLWTGATRQVHITIAGADEQEASPELCMILQQAIASLGNPLQAVQIESYQPFLFNLKATVGVNPRYLPQQIENQIIKNLQETFAFKKREFGQGVAASEVIEIIQKVEGVVAVDLDSLYVNSQPETLNSFLAAKTAYWEGKKTKPAQLLLLNSAGVVLTMEHL